VTAVGALWLDGSFWFQTGSRTRKARNVARRPALLRSRVSILDTDVVAEGAQSGRLTLPHSRALPRLGGPGVARRTR